MIQSNPGLPALAVLVSGGGSNLQAIIDATASGKLAARVAVVISSRNNAYGLVRARKAGIPSRVLRHADFADRPAFEAALCRELERYQPALIILAGFMRILSAGFVEHYAGRILNIHPSLLPAYTGINTHQRVLEAGDAEHGATVHLVTAELDRGPIIRQASVPVRQGDTVDSLAARVLEQEHLIYPAAIQQTLDQQQALAADGQPEFSAGI